MIETSSVANGLLDIADEHGSLVTPMKLQKLIYYAQGWHLALVGTPLINETIEAWRYGPVVSSVYRSFKGFGNMPIKSRMGRGSSPSKDSVEGQLLQKIWQEYGSYTAIDLSAATHEDGTPWSQIWDDDSPINGLDIPNPLIKEYFLGLIDGNVESSDQ